jgi:DNA-binding SARP family transcriptional activator
MLKRAAIPKVSRPRAAQVAPRERLFATIDDARAHPALWIAAPPGSGKTTLLASYLETRKRPGIWFQVDRDDTDPATFFHYMNVAAEAGGRVRRGLLPRMPTEAGIDVGTFARRYFRALFAVLPGDTVIVLDNYQDGTDSPLDTILRHAIEETPSGALLVVLSLTPTPAALARLVATQTVTRLDPERLRFTLEEARAVASCFDSIDPATIGALHEQSGGWAAGLVLMLEHQRHAGGSDSTSSVDAHGAVFDYFAEEILARAPVRQQHVLMAASFPACVPAHLAAALTGDPEAVSLLDDLTRRHLFTTRTTEAEPTYRFHALFRAFLQARARDRLGIAERRELTLRTARLLEAHGRIEDAIGAALEWDHHDAAAAMILRNAPTLFEQGRRRLLSGWIAALPGDAIDHEPWLAYWAGAGQVFVDAQSGRRLLERAYERFVDAGDVAGQVASAGAITRACIHEIRWSGLDRWLAVLDGLLSGPCDSVPPRMLLQGLARALYVTVIRQPQHPRAREWADRAMALLGADIDPNDVAMAAFSLMMHYNWYGSAAAQERIIGWVQPLATEGRLNPVSATYWSWVFALYLLNARASDEALCAMDRAIDTAASHGLLIAAVLRQFRVGMCLSLGKVGEAAASMAQLDDVGHALPRVEPYNEMKSWLALAQGDFARAEGFVQSALQIASDRGRTLYRIIDLFLLAVVQVESNAFERARATIAEYRQHTEGVAGFLPCYQADLVDAYLALRQGKTKDCHAALRAALAAGRRERIVNHWTWFAPMMSRLYAEALKQGIEVDYVRDVIQRRGLLPEAPYSASWPWPLRVRTLGSFEVLRHGVPLAWEGKAQRKPLELLKVLIALGGRDVPVDKLIGLLWPAAMNGEGQKSLEITVHRLRKLLDVPESVRMSDRRATLNPQLVFVDARALDDELASVIPPVNAPEPDIGLLEAAAPTVLEFFRGAFLPGDDDDPWVMATRNRLSGRFERFVQRLGAHWERQQRWELASSLYARAIELDPLGETFYRRQMVCLHAQDRRAEAIEVFRRCRQMLSVVLSIKPSPETEATYARIAGDAPPDVLQAR